MLEAVVPVAPPALGAKVRLAVAPPGGIVGVSAYRGRAAALRAALGVALPEAPLRVVSDGVTWLWSGVESWLAVGEAGLGARLEPLRDHAAVVDQSHGRVVLHVTGPRAVAALARLVPIDLDPRVFGENATALTLAGGIGVQIWRVEEGFALACFTSFAQALADAVGKAARYV